MPKQQGPVYFTGTRGDACFYKMDGQYYVRKKSSLSGKRVKHAPSFELTRVYADLLAQASRLAAAVYRLLPKEQKNLVLYRAMTGEALRMLKQGVNVEVISAQLQAYCAPKVVKVKPAERKRKAVTAPGGMRVAGMGNIHFAFPKQVRVYITPEGKLEVRLTNRTKMKKEHERVAME
ncbi:hypothetical protein [Chitinophaga sp. GbtcB8]|uniref:hypothetical protein n=1 Tax=Chitinophaga sp. GbtcB8 TaxID=2824753 RepID=UPI001C2F31F2|nr:hypothetical protein [Chitinophaga sp. GbtcB8]